MKIKKLTKETEFPRAWEDVETGIAFVTQPYISGCYMAGSKEGHTVYQGGFLYSKIATFLKNLRKLETEGKVQNLRVNQLGSFLSESDFEILNS